MITKANISLFIQVALGLMCIVLLLRSPKQIYPVTKQKTIEKRIKGKETIIKQQGYVIDNSKLIISQLNDGLFDLQEQLELVKKSRDTFKIVQIQDTMIHVLYEKDKQKDLVIASQDTVISAQRYIINSKDTIITAQKFDIKKLKTQRNWFFVLSAMLTGALIMK